MKPFLLWSVALLIGATSCTDQIIQNEKKPFGPVELTFSASNGEMSPGTTTRTLVREGLNRILAKKEPTGFHPPKIVAASEM